MRASKSLVHESRPSRVRRPPDLTPLPGPRCRLAEGRWPERVASVSRPSFPTLPAPATPDWGCGESGPPPTREAGKVVKEGPTGAGSFLRPHAKGRRRGSREERAWGGGGGWRGRRGGKGVGRKERASRETGGTGEEDGEGEAEGEGEGPRRGRARGRNGRRRRSAGGGAFGPSGALRLHPARPTKSPGRRGGGRAGRAAERGRTAAGDLRAGARLLRPPFHPVAPRRRPDDNTNLSPGPTASGEGPRRRPRGRAL